MPVYYDKQSKRFFVRVYIKGKPKTARRDNFGNMFYTKETALEYEAVFYKNQVEELSNKKKLKENKKLIKFSMKKLMNLWLSWKEQNHKLTTIYSLRMTMTKNVANVFPDVPILKLTQHDFDAWRKWMQQQPVTFRYKNDVLNQLINMLEFANIFYDINLPYAKRLNRFADYGVKPRKTFEHVYSLNQLCQFLEHTTDLMHFTLYLLMFFTGIRPGEARSLLVSDIDCDRNLLYINKDVTNKIGRNGWILQKPKTTRSERVVNLPRCVTYYLYKYLDKYHINPTPNAFLFHSRYGVMQPMSSRHLADYTNEVAKSAKLPHTSPNAIGRHSYATFCEENLTTQIAIAALYAIGRYRTRKGDDVLEIIHKAVAETLGHSDTRITQEYYDHSLAKLSEAIPGAIDEVAFDTIMTVSVDTVLRKTPHLNRKKAR